MVAKEISVKKYVVRLTADEREQLEVLIRKGKSPAQRLLKARILLKADVSEAGEGWRQLPTPLRGGAISESMAAWIAVICSSSAKSS